VHLSPIPRDWKCLTDPACSWSAETLALRFPHRLFDLGQESGAQATLPSFLSATAGAADGAAADGAAADGAAADGAAADANRYIFDPLASDCDPLLCDYYAPAGAPASSNQCYLHYLSSFPALRPRFRWFLVGVQGSGFAPHQDPHGTCAWNALVVGRKQWAVLPPCTPLAAVFPGITGSDVPLEFSSARLWFQNALPLLAGLPGLKVFEQAAGEVVWIPAGWWHCACTVSEVSVGVTQNWLTKSGFEEELDKLQRTHSALAPLWAARVHSAGLPFTRAQQGEGTSVVHA
jgi:hypothetical protein